MKAKHPKPCGNRIDPRVSLCSILETMKATSLLTLSGLAILLASCGSLETFNQPLSGNSDFDPLTSPGSSSSRSLVVAPTSPSYAPGQWVETSMDNATFFNSIPKGNAQADKVFPSGTPMKVVSNKGTYVRVELDSGAVGYIPEIMIAERRPASEVPLTMPVEPAPDLGSVPPIIEPDMESGEGIAPPPEIPGTPPPVPEIAPLPDSVPPVPAVPEVAPEESDIPPTVPEVAPPPEIPGITDPEDID